MPRAPITARTASEPFTAYILLLYNILSMTGLPTRFPVRATDQGAKVWTCPLCGFENHSQVRYNRPFLKCRGRDCQRRFVFGNVFQLAPRGRAARIPTDVLLPARSPLHYLEEGDGSDDSTPGPTDDDGTAGTD